MVTTNINELLRGARYCSKLTQFPEQHYYYPHYKDKETESPKLSNLFKITVSKWKNVTSIASSVILFSKPYIWGTDATSMDW